MATTKTYIGKQEEGVAEKGVEFNTSDPVSPISTQTWVNATYNTFITNNGSNIYLNKNETPVVLPALDLDAHWTKELKIISTNTAFTFSNFQDGVAVELHIFNSASSTCTLTFPLGIVFLDPINDVILQAKETRIFTFTQVGVTIYCSIIKNIFPITQTWLWGANTQGQLGDSTTISRSLPVSIVGGHLFPNIARGASHCLGLKYDQSCWSWGYNLNGQLGDRSTSNKSSPVLVAGNHSFINISCTGDTTNNSYFLSLGLKADGSVWGWGYNGSGQLGNLSTGYRSSPVAVIGSHNFIAISAGGNSACGLKSDGSIWSWGANSGGQLGANVTANQSSPVLVIGNHSFISIEGIGSSAGSHKIALKSDGSAWCWGTNANGEIGDNSLTNRSSPSQVTGNHSFIAVKGTDYISFGLKADGSVWSWGDDAYGQLGDGITANGQSSPILITGNHSFINIFTTTADGGANGYSFGIKLDGSCWSWGSNGSGQLGNGTTNGKSSPTLIVGNYSFSNIYQIKEPTPY